LVGIAALNICGLLILSLLAADGTDAGAASDAARDGGGDASAAIPSADAGATADTAKVSQVPAGPPQALPTRIVFGEVLERGTRRRLGEADVVLDDVATTTTDSGGQFQLSLPPGRHRVRAVATGFEPVEIAIGWKGQPNPLVFRLKRRDSEHAYETVVRPDGAPAPVFTLQKEELTRVPGALGDPFRAIETLPGVATVAWPFPIYAIRGTNPGNTGYFIDDVRVPSLFHFALGPAVVHPYILDRLDFYAGGYPARYGRFVGGTVVASTHAPPEDLVHLSVDARLFDVGVLASAPFDERRGTVTLSGRYSYTSALLSLFNSDLSIAYSDAQLRVEHTLGPGRITLFAFGSSDALDSKDPTNTQDHLHMRFVRALLKYVAPLGPGRVGVSVGGGLDSSRAPLDSGTFSDLPSSMIDSTLSVRSSSTEDRLWYRVSAGRVVDLEAGVDEETTWYLGASSNSNPAVGDLARDRTVVLTGAYIGLTLRLGGRLVLIPAFREDLYKEGAAMASSPGPRLSGRLRLGEALWINGAIGHYTQLPSLPLQVSGFENFGLLEYGLQSAWQSSLGVETQLPLGLSLEATGFLQRSVLTDVRDPNSGDYLLDDYLVRRQALAYGAEVLIRRPMNARLYGWLSYTLSRSLRLFEGGNIGPSSWDQTHVFNLVLGYRIGAWILGGRGHLNTGRPAKIDGTLPVEATRLPLYYQIDLRIERRFVLDRWTLNGYVEVLNATLNRQVTGLSQEATGLHETGYTVAVPSIGVRAEF